MANLLAHALFALALFSVITSLIQGTPMTVYGFVAALAALPSDLEVDRGSIRRTPYGHSLAYGLFWALLILSALSLLAWLGLLSQGSWPLLLSACLMGLVSHLLLDALGAPGILTWPKRGQWGLVAMRSLNRIPSFDLLISWLSIGAILAVLVLY